MAAPHTARFNERTTGRYTAVLVDESDVPVGSTIITALTLTLYDKASGAIINSRNDQNALNANGVTLDVSGNLAWTVSYLDNVILDSGKHVEHHVALFEWVWASGTKEGRHEVAIQVVNLEKVS